MSKDNRPALFSNSLWRFFASVKFSILVLICLATTSIMGTLIPQNQPLRAYVNAYGKVAAGVLDVFDVFDMYHSWWYQGLLIVLVINLIVCSIDKIYATRKILFAKKPAFKVSRFRRSGEPHRFSSSKDLGELKALCRGFVGDRFSVTATKETENGFAVFGEKGRWTRFGVYAVHLSLVLLLFGALFGSMLGFDGSVKINEGESTDTVFLKDGKNVVKLGFEIRCDDFDVSFYKNGSPKEYRSKLSILKEGKVVHKKEIIVNDPLRFEGINMFQSSYGTSLPTRMTVEMTSKETGMTYTEEVGFNEPIEIPEGLGVFEITNFTSNYDFSGRGLGEAFLGVLKAPGKKDREVVMLVRFPSFDRMRKGEVFFTVPKFEKKYYTGLQVTKDPGIWVVYAGCLMLILGCYITFFMSHQSVCVEVAEDDKGTSVSLSGYANKNRIGMKNTLKRLSEKLFELV